jgi:hypothetical protein
LKTGEVLRPDMALFATGRLVDTEGLGLDSAGVKLNPRGVVEVDNHFQTNIEGVYAAGDVIGPSLASVSTEQGRVAACHALGLGFKEKLDPLSVSAVYSVPELAGVGLTEDNAKEQGIDYEVGRCSFGEIPRGLISGDTDGILKLVFRRKDRRLLGIHILGDIASELIALGQATLYNSGTIDVFNNLTVATPTYTMAYKYAAFDGFKRLAATGGSLQCMDNLTCIAFVIKAYVYLRNLHLTCENPNHKRHVMNFVEEYPTTKGRVPHRIILVDPKDWSVDLKHPKKNTTECCQVCSIAEDIARAEKGIGTTGLGQICSRQWGVRY